MCIDDEKECHDIERIQEGFLINRTVASIEEISIMLRDENEELVTETGDYEVRQGVTGFPVTSADLPKVLPVLHSKLQAINFLVNRLLVRANTHYASEVVLYGIKREVH